MIRSFVEENFFYLHPGYTTFNTVVFGVVLGVIILGIMELFKRIDKDPEELLISLIPIIIFGSTSRALVDHHVYPRIHLLATPGIYIAIGLFTILLLITSLYVEKYLSIKYNKFIFMVGCILAIPNLCLIAIHGFNIIVCLFELSIVVVSYFMLCLLKRKIEFLANDMNVNVLTSHIFDATSTFTAIDFFNYSEQHVIPTFMINITHTSLVMYPLKIGVIAIILYVIDKQITDEKYNHTIKLAIFILALAPAIRNLTTLILAI
ncbi:MAG: hypothetical protein BZ136_03515 [Methanosphaera sp. rholeuAM74]|nr:MAG: hypothetical protein BZ136_03515 [Methanosphaera sp. rholeuAM74]